MPTPWPRTSSAEWFRLSPVVTDWPILAEGGQCHLLRGQFEILRNCHHATAFCVLVLAMAFACTPDTLMAVSVHECKGSDGVVRFQDSPCLPGEASRIRHLSGDPIQTTQESAPVADVSDSRQAAEPTTQQQAPAMPPSSTFLCQRDNGSRYISDSGVGNRHRMPIGMMGYPPMSLGQAYAGPNGIGVSAPEVNNVPVVPSRGGAMAGMGAWVEDPCTRVTGAALCDFYAAQLSDAQRRLRYAFSDSTRKVSGQIEDWGSRLASCHR